MIITLLLFFSVIRLTFGALDTRLFASVLSLLAVLLGAGVFIKSAVMLDLFTVREWLLLPFGEKILRIGGKNK